MTKKRSSTRQQSTKGSRISLGTVIGIILIAIVLFAQYVLGVDVLPEEETKTSTPAADVTQDPTSVANAPDSALTPIDGGYDGGWFQLYFTTPINTTDESKFTGSPLEQALVAALDKATTSIDAAIFELNSQPVTDALIRAFTERGVKVRIVTDGEHGLESPETTIDQLDDEDIPIVSDGNRGGFMHNKFFVIDGQYVWTGSTNITHNDIYNNNNNSMFIRSSQLAANYTQEFNELFAGQFGTTSPNTVPNPSININGTPIETYFESEGDVPSQLVTLINNAHSVRFMAFSLTRDDLIQPMLTRAQAGQLDLMGIVEASQRRFAKPLFCSDLQIRQDGNPDILHHKIFIIDESIVVMGSFNFSAKAANENDENTLIIHNTAIAKAYLEEFNKRWSEAKTVSKTDLGC